MYGSSNAEDMTRPSNQMQLGHAPVHMEALGDLRKT